MKDEPHDSDEATYAVSQAIYALNDRLGGEIAVELRRIAVALEALVRAEQNKTRFGPG